MKNSPYSSLIFLVEKYDELWCICIDYKALNKVIIKDKLSIPMINDILEELHGA
jgi:hypothetical protein